MGVKLQTIKFRVFMTFVFLMLGLSSIPLTCEASTAVCNQNVISQRTLAFMQKHHIYGAVVLLANHGKLSTCLFGEANPARHIPVSEDTIFELGSVTKTFTGILLAQSSLIGKTHLARPIEQDFSTPLSTTLKKINHLELATYTSGLPFNAEGLAYNAAGSLNNRMKLAQYLKKSKPVFSPGSHMLYSNLGFGLLGQILAKKENLSLDELMRRDILSPLKMNDSSLNLGQSRRRHLAQGYTAEGKPVSYRSAGLFGGTWAMRATAKDMRAYLMAVLGDNTQSKKLHQAIQVSQKAYYAVPSKGMQIGLGWLITALNQKENVKKLIHQPDYNNFIPYKVTKIQNPKYDPNSLISKTGATDGFRAYIAVIPAKHTGIVIMINRFTSSSGVLPNLANEILLNESHVDV